jgi:hypothetical protein
MELLGSLVRRFAAKYASGEVTQAPADKGNGESERAIHSPSANDDAPAPRPAVDGLAADGESTITDAVPAGSQRTEPTHTTVPLSFSVMSSGQCVVAVVPVAHVAEFLNDLGKATVKHNLADVQLWAQRRRSRTDPKPEIWGVLCDFDVAVDDPFGVLVDAGLPIPTAWWRTLNGWKPLWLFDRAANKSEFEAIAEQFTLSAPGGDPQSWSTNQAQHLPIVNKSTTNGLVVVTFDATQSNAQPMRVDDFVPELPVRLERAAGAGGRLSSGERKVVEDFLHDLGLTPPGDHGRSHGPFDRCLVTEQHDRPCCYVIRDAEGALRVTCMGGHGGEGVKRWSETALYGLATGSTVIRDGVVALHDIPVTWAGAEYMEQRWSALFVGDTHVGAQLRAARRVWMRARLQIVNEAARKRAAVLDAEVARGMSSEKALWYYEGKISGFDQTGPCRVAFNGVSDGLCILRDGGSVDEIHVRGETLSVAPHLHEWKASSAFDIRAKELHDKKTGAITLALGPDLDVTNYRSHWNKAFRGGRPHLAALGVPVLHNFPLPIAFQNDDCTIDHQTKCLSVTRTARMGPSDPKFDALDFFSQLQRRGQLPLASEKDVPRFLMAMASPLIRAIAPGLLGVYVFDGPSGSGKEYLIVTMSDTWQGSILLPTIAYYEIHDVDDLEQNRNFHAASASAVYLRAVEAGKSLDKINALIRYSTSRYVTARGMYASPRQILNVFTYVADAVEGLPPSREISRRTVTIATRNIDERVSKGEVREKIIANAASIIHWLKAKVEGQSPSWFRNQVNTQTRQVGQAALAKLFDAELPVVTEGSVDELFELVLAYKQSFAQSEGEEQLAKAKARGPKGGKEPMTFHSYRLSHLIETMKDQVGAQQFFRRYASQRSLEMHLRREVNYHDVEAKRLPYLRVNIDGTFYAFTFVNGGRNFVLEPELAYCDKLGIVPISPASEAVTVPVPDSAQSRLPAVAGAASSPNNHTTGPIRISATEIHRRNAARTREASDGSPDDK